jgi:N-methylhydantoinase B
MIRNRGRTDELEVSKIEEIRLDRGDTLTVLMPGAAGYGDPFLRDAEAVRSDVELGFVGRDAARKEYGVVIGADGEIDAQATRKARRARVKDNIRADFDFGPEREAWEAVFDDQTMCEINRRLFALPRSVRQERRRQLFDRAVPNMPAAGTASVVKLLAASDKVRARIKAAMDELLG